MHNSYLNGADHWPKTLPSALNVIFKWKEEKRPPAHQYESSEGFDLTTKGKTGGFMGECYNCGKS